MKTWIALCSFVVGVSAWAASTPPVPVTSVQVPVDVEKGRLCFRNNIKSWDHMKLMRLIPNAAVCSGMTKMLKGFYDYAKFSPNCKIEKKATRKDATSWVREIRRRVRLACPDTNKVVIHGACNVYDFCNQYDKLLQKAVTGVQTTTLFQRSLPNIEHWNLSHHGRDVQKRQQEVKRVLTSFHQRLSKGEIPVLMFHAGWGGIADYHYVLIWKYEKINISNDPSSTFIRLSIIDPNTRPNPPTAADMSGLSESQRRLRLDNFRYELANSSLSFVFDGKGNLNEDKSSGNIGSGHMIFDMTRDEKEGRARCEASDKGQHEKDDLDDWN